ncbi:MAG: hypothetical protein LAT67_04700 [Balneolales bacterium]|nr:hypothetical protein [Balneolales bacterium]
MKSNLITQILIVLSFALLLSACSSRVAIQDVNFAQPIEVVAQTNAQGQFEDVRSGLTFNVLPMLEKEGIELSAFSGAEVRFIRNHQGYYFVTAAGFRNVYVMQVRENELRSTNIIRVSDNRLQGPAFNQRNPLIQLIDGDRIINLTKNGIQS